MDIARVKRIVENQIDPPITSRAKTLLLSFTQQRSFRAYCVGTAKSGTHSVAAVFQKNYRAAHEPEGCNLIYLKMLLEEGKLSKDKLNKVLKRRDVRLNLDMESSDFAGYFHDELAKLDPKSNFLLPIRDCYSFLDSIINHQINKPIVSNSAWGIGRDINYQSNQEVYPEQESELAARDGLYKITGYLNYWVNRNRQVLENIPASRLLAFKTNELKTKLPAIATLLKIDKNSLTVTKSHAFKATQSHNILSKMDVDYIEQIVDETGCRDIMKEFYPEISNVSDIFEKDS